MATRDDRSLFQRLFEMGEERLNRLAEELLSNPRFAEAIGKTLQKAMETKGRVDRNMQTVLGLLNLPSKADYKKLATKIEALQGSLVNLNIKLDRMLAQQHTKVPQPKRPRVPKAPHAHSPEPSAES
jgi:hypothetical protein